MGDAKYLESGFREMVKSDLQGGTVSIRNVAYDCTVGTFSKQDILVSGGISPHMIGDVQILLSDLPVGLEFTLGLDVTVLPNTGKARDCKIHSTQNAGNHINLILRDVNEGA